MYASNDLPPTQKPPLSTKEKMIFDFLCAEHEKKGLVPTRAEIAEHFNFRSANSAQQYIRQLVNKGYLRNTGLKQGLMIVQEVEREDLEQDSSYRIPLLGKVAAGLAVESQQIEDEIEVPPMMLGKDTSRFFALRIRGLSMIEDGIMEDDIVLVEESQTAKNGDIVVATVNGESTVKRFYKKGKTIELIPANHTMKPILVKSHDDLQIRGIVRSLMRKF